MITRTTPTSTVDLFSDDVLIDPYPTYANLRELGAAVYLEHHDVWALPRYADIRATLGNWKTFSSVGGVGLNDVVNEAMAGTVLATDPPEHDRLRAVLRDQLAPKGLVAITEHIKTCADQLVRDLVDAGEFDAVGQLAREFVSSVVTDLIGVPASVRNKLLSWADHAFTAFGPLNERTQAAMPVVQDLLSWMSTVTAQDLTPGSMGRSIFDAAERGDIEPESCIPLLHAYLVAAMDTTINGISNAIFLLGEHPDQWQRLREDPSLIPATLNEVLRYDSPVQAFSRVVRGSHQFGDTVVGDGERVLLLYGSGNRDDRHYDRADQFDISRNPVDHLSFGYGTHGCAGQALARLEAHAILTSLATHAQRLEIGEPVRHLNNVIRGLDALPVRVVPSTASR